MDDLLVERVLRAVECVPPARLVTYGDIAALIGTGPRVVGAVMARWGGGVAWWRVVNARGALPVHLVARARPHWLEEGIALQGDDRVRGGSGAEDRDGARSGRVSLAGHRMASEDLRRVYCAATADLPPQDEGGPHG